MSQATHGLKEREVAPNLTAIGQSISMTDVSTFSIPSELVTRAKTRVACWFDLAEEPASLRPKVLSGIERIASELPRRSNWFEVMTVGLDDSASLPIHVETPQFSAFLCSKCLAVSTIVPGWNFGWRKVLKNDEVYQILSWFLHYARQYIHRSYVARVLMIAWEEHGKVLLPFGSRSIDNRYGPIVPMISAKQSLETARLEALKEWGNGEPLSEVVPVNSPWLGRNTLDPLLHQAVFHFLRAQNLKSENFATEAVVGFDCVIQSIAAFIYARRGLSTEPTWGQVCEQLQLSAKSAELAEYIYFIRNNFGAHTGGWRWWDQNELFDDIKLDDIALLGGAVLSAAADLEPHVRAIEPFPNQWGLWFFENFDMLWDAVCFEKHVKWQKAKHGALR